MKNYKIYKGQTELIFLISMIDQSGVAVNLEDATVVLFLRKPNKEIHELAPTIENEASGTISYVPENEKILNQVGVYTIWPKVTFQTGRKINGQPYDFKVFEPGT